MLTSDVIRQGASQQTSKATREELPLVREVAKKLKEMGKSALNDDIVTTIREHGHNSPVDTIVSALLDGTYPVLTLIRCIRRLKDRCE